MSKIRIHRLQLKHVVADVVLSAVGATLPCKITTQLIPPKGVLLLMLTQLHSPSRMDAANYISLCLVVHSPLIPPHNNYGVTAMKTKNTPVPNNYSLLG